MEFAVCFSIGGNLQLNYLNWEQRDEIFRIDFKNPQLPTL